MPSFRHAVAAGLVKAQPSLGSLPIAEVREIVDDLACLLPTPADIESSAVRIGNRRAEWLRAPETPADPVALYLHGGGYCFGSIESHRGLASRIALASGVRILLPEYALAPEEPFPRALEDVQAAYRFLLDCDVGAGEIVLCGDSAGGGLALALLLSLPTLGLPMPRACVCLSPWIDLTLSGDSAVEGRVDDPLILPADAERLAAAYAGSRDRREPLISPLFGDLEGLPPILIQVGTREILLDDSVRFSERARQAGVDVTLDIWPEMIHVWQFFGPVPEAREAVRGIGDWMREKLGPGERMHDRGERS